MCLAFVLHLPIAFEAQLPAAKPETTTSPASAHGTHQQDPFLPGPRRQPPSTVHRLPNAPPPPSPISHPTFLIRRCTGRPRAHSTALPVREAKRNSRETVGAARTGRRPDISRAVAGRHAGRRSRIPRPARRRQVERCGCAAPQRL